MSKLGSRYYNRRFLADMLYYDRLNKRDPQGCWDMFMPGYSSRVYDFELEVAPKEEGDIFYYFKLMRTRLDDGKKEIGRVFRYPVLQYDMYDQIYPGLIILDG